MSDNAEYNQLVSDKQSAERRVREASNARAAIEEKVDRLKDAKRALGRCHDDFGDVKKTVKRDIEDHYSWEGSQYDRFMSNGENLIRFNQDYYDNIDAARDEINLEIARLENEIYRQEGIIGELHSLINSLVHRIENFFN